MFKQNIGISIKTKQKIKLFPAVPNRHFIFFSVITWTDIFPQTLWVINCIGLFPGSLRIVMSTMVVAVFPKA